MLGFYRLAMYFRLAAMFIFYLLLGRENNIEIKASVFIMAAWRRL